MRRKQTKACSKTTTEETLPYKEMIRRAIQGLRDKQGSSKKEILNYVTANFDVDKDVGKNIEAELRLGVKDGTIVQFSKGKSRTRLFKLDHSKKKSTEESAEKNTNECTKKTTRKKVRFENESGTSSSDTMTRARLPVKVKEAKVKRKAAATAKKEASKKKKTGRRKKKRTTKPDTPKKLSERAINAKILAYFEEIWKNM